MSNETRREMQPDGSFRETASIASNSIEIQRAKDGTYYWTIKIYYRPDEEAEQTVSLIAQIDNVLLERFGPKGDA